MKIPKKLTDVDDLADARIKYQASIGIFTSEGQIQWVRYSCMLLVNTILIGLIGASFDGGFRIPLILKFLFSFVPIFGLILCYLWYRMTERGFNWMDFWITKARNIEYQIAGEINPIQEGNDQRLSTENGVTKKASLLVIKIFWIVYFVSLLINVFNLGFTLSFR